MKIEHLLAVSAAALCTLSVLSARVHGAALAYTVTDLGTSGGISSEAHGINAFGQVLGDRYFPGSNPLAVLWTGTTPTNIGPVGYHFALGMVVSVCHSD